MDKIRQQFADGLIDFATYHRLLLPYFDKRKHWYDRV